MPTARRALRTAGLVVGALCVLIAPSAVAAQQGTESPAVVALRRSVDSLANSADLKARVRALHALGRAQENERHFGAARESYRIALGLAIQDGDSTTIATARHGLGASHFRANQYDSAIVHLGASREIRTALGDATGLASTLNSLGASFYQVAQYEAALEAFLTSLSIRRAAGDRAGVSRVLTNIAKTYQDWRRYDLALPIFLDAVASTDTIADRFGAGYVFNSLGRYYIDTEEYDLARENLERSLAFYRTFGTTTVAPPDSLAGWLINTIDFGLLHVREGRPVAAVPLLERAVSVAATGGTVREQALARLTLAQAYEALGQAPRAIAEYRRSLALSRSSVQRVMALDALSRLADLEESRGNVAAALRDLREEKALRDTIFDGVTAQRIAAMQGRAENARLLEERRLQEALLARQRRVGVLGGLVIVLAVVVVVLLLRNGRRARERERALGAANAELARANAELRAATSEVRALTGLIPICANCKSVRDDRGFWEGVESYVSNRSSVMFSHSLCPKCGPQFFGEDWHAHQDDANGPSASSA